MPAGGFGGRRELIGTIAREILVRPRQGPLLFPGVALQTLDRARQFVGQD